MIKYGEVEFRQVSANLYETTKPFTYQGSTDTFTIPTGFPTDFATVPTVLQWLVPKVGAYNYASLVHDYLCVNEILSGEDTDGIFRRLLRECNVPWLLRNLMWFGVRLGSLGNSYRRKGWLSTFPRFFALFPAALILVAPPTLLACIARGIILTTRWVFKQ